MEKKERSDFIDGLRGGAALMVMLFHGRQLLWIGFSEYQLRHADWDFNKILAVLSVPLRFGYWGVTLFFVLSGYCIHLRGARMGIIYGKGRMDWKEFWLKRFWRLYPAYFFAILFTLLCVTLMNEQIHWRTVLGSLLFLQTIVVDNLQFNDPFWSLSVEIQLYLLYPFLVFLARTIGANGVLIFTAFLSFLTNILWIYGIVIPFMLVLSAWFPWTIGFWIAEKCQNLVLKRIDLFWIVVIVCLGVFLCLLLHLMVSSRAGQEPLIACVFGGIIYFAFSKGAVSWKACNVSGQFLVWIGAISYSLYLLHRPMQFLIRYWFEKRYGFIPDNFSLYIGGIFLCLGLAWCSYLWIESAFIQMGQRVMKGRRL